MSKKEVLALIPARGGSKSVPRKNIIKLGGKPMIGWAIEVARQSKLITRVVVTTDCEEIAKVAKEYGAEVPFLRPKEISGDRSLDIEFHIHALQWLEENEGYRPDYVLNLRPTPPARKAETIDAAITHFMAHPEADSLRSVHLASESPFKMWCIAKDGFMASVAKIDGVREPYNQPRQNLPLVYWQDGYIDITTPRVILEKKSTTGDRILPFEIYEPAADIDYPDDIELAEAQLKLRDTPSSKKENSKDEIRFPS